MFVETAIACFALGWLACGAYVWFVCFRPENKARDAQRLAEFRISRQQVYRAEARRKHLGTPYIIPAALPEELDRLVDDHIGSRKAPELRVVS